jgi:hypothetical protein
LLALTACALAACAPPRESPEAELRRTIARAVEAAEARDLGELRQLVSGNYRDEQGYDREGVLALARAVLLAHGNVYIVARVTELELPAPGHAFVAVIAGTAGRRIGDAADAGELRARLYRFELEFAEEDRSTWRVTSARWRPASPAEAI